MIIRIDDKLDIETEIRSKDRSAGHTKPVLHRYDKEVKLMQISHLCFNSMSVQRNNNRVYIVDDDGAVGKALGLLLESLGLDPTVYTNPEEFLNTLSRLKSGCVIMDIRMPHISGLRLQKRLAELGYSWPVIIISGHGGIDACRKAFRAGAIDFLSKPVDELDLIDAVQQGLKILEVAESEDLDRQEVSQLFSELTKRELEVLEMITRGFMNKEIAESLILSPRTIESHRAKLNAKLKTNSVAEQTRLHAEYIAYMPNK